MITKSSLLPAWDRAGFTRLLWAGFTKFRTVRGLGDRALRGRDRVCAPVLCQRLGKPRARPRRTHRPGWRSRLRHLHVRAPDARRRRRPHRQGRRAFGRAHPAFAHLGQRLRSVIEGSARLAAGAWAGAVGQSGNHPRTGHEPGNRPCGRDGHRLPRCPDAVRLHPRQPGNRWRRRAVLPPVAAAHPGRRRHHRL